MPAIPGQKRALLLLVTVLSVAVFWVMYKQDMLRPDVILRYTATHPYRATALFLLACTVLSTALLPVNFALNLLAGVAWGAWWGGLLTTIGLNASAALCFLIARRLGQDVVLEQFRKRGWLWAMDTLEQNSWQFVVLARINPVVPFSVANFMFGLTTISFRTFLTASVLGSIVPNVFYAAVGASLGTLAFTHEVGQDMQNIGLAVLLFTVLYVMRVFGKAYMARRAREA